jgi:hypothetical protein
MELQAGVNISVTVATAGTAVQATATETYVLKAEIQADPANRGLVYYGPSGVTNTTGIALAPGEIREITGSKYKGTDVPLDVSTLWVTAERDASKVRIIGYQSV